MKTRLFIALLLSLCIGSPEVSSAHAFPDHSDPRVGATVEGPPAFVRIWFDGALESAFTTIFVQDDNGQRMDKGDGRVNPSDPTLLEVPLQPLPPGTYHVIWDVLARDGHRTKGDFTFAVK